MPDLRDGNWNKELEGGLPDCRLRYSDRERNIVMRGRLAMEVVYCAQCYQPRGLVTAEWTPHVFFICDECMGRCQTKPEGTMEIPEAVVQGRSITR